MVEVLCAIFECFGILQINNIIEGLKPYSRFSSLMLLSAPGEVWTKHSFLK